MILNPLDFILLRVIISIDDNTLTISQTGKDKPIIIPSSAQEINIPNLIRFSGKLISSSNSLDIENNIKSIYDLKSVEFLDVRSKDIIILVGDSGIIPNYLPQIFQDVILKNIDNISSLNRKIQRTSFRFNDQLYTPRFDERLSKILDTSLGREEEFDCNKYEIFNYDKAIIYNPKNVPILNLPTTHEIVYHRYHVKISILENNNQVKISTRDVLTSENENIIEIVRRY